MANVLLVEDHPDVREMIAELLQSRGHHVHTSTSAEAALQHLADDSETYDVVIADENLPGISGMQLLQKIRENHKIKTVPVIICSAADSLRQTARQAGALDFWLKGSEDLFDAVERLDGMLRPTA